MKRLLAAAALVSLPLLLGLRCAVAEGVFVSEDFMRARALAYLEYATSSQSNSPWNAISHMERDLVDPSYTAPVGAIDVDAWSGTFDKHEKLLDTRDFDQVALVNAYLGYEGHPYLTPAMWDKIRTTLLSFKYWYSPDPTPPMPDPARPERTWDESFYWTENHQIIYHAVEYLGGQRFPDECFWIVGFGPPDDPVACDGPGEMRGSAHRDRARALILEWLDARWQFGFSEWHSNIYMEEDFMALMALAEFAEDEEIVSRVSMILDHQLFNLAVLTHETSLLVTHGRTEMKDSHRGPANDTWDMALFLYEQQDRIGFDSTSDKGATSLARSKRYRIPDFFRDIATDPTAFADRQSTGVPIDETLSPTQNPPPPPDPPLPLGYDFQIDDRNFTFWWGMGAWTVWQVVPNTIVTATALDLWEIRLLQPFAPFRDLLGDPPNIGLGVQVAGAIWPLAAVGLQKQVDTYAWRTEHYVMSTAQDYRKGANAGQQHTWNATFSPDAHVFTTHPMNPRQPPAEFIGQTDGQPGYWTGSASLPRSAQHENVGIHLYSPLYADGGFLGAFDYEALTHAYFPREQFDEWTQVGHWTLARDGDGYVALWSWRETAWEAYTPEELSLMADGKNGPITLSYDLIAPGGPDNVWIVECGTAEDWGSFASFVDAVTAAQVTVTPAPSGIDDNSVFDVVYESPSQGTLTFGWDAPLTVAGDEIDIDGYPRWSNPWVEAERGAPLMIFHRDEARLLHDWSSATRAGYRLPGRE